MSTLLAKPAAPETECAHSLWFHKRIAIICVAMVIAAFAGCRLASISLGVANHVVAIVVLFAMLAPLPIYWHQKGRVALRESVLVLGWEILVAVVAPFLVLIAGRSRLPLQDALFGHIDGALGMSSPAIVAWANRHWIGGVLHQAYLLLLPFLITAALLPAFAGKVRHAREFLLANLVSFIIGFALFALLPAVGPWYYYHTAPLPLQANCQRLLFALRLPGPYKPGAQAAAIVCFPSFHTIWAILSAAALWGFRVLRIPAALLAAMIVVSTVTTGWHYVSDVVAGIALAVFAMVAARAYTN